MLARQTLLFPF